MVWVDVPSTSPKARDTVASFDAPDNEDHGTHVNSQAPFGRCAGMYPLISQSIYHVHFQQHWVATAVRTLCYFDSLGPFRISEYQDIHFHFEDPSAMQGSNSSEACM